MEHFHEFDKLFISHLTLLTNIRILYQNLARMQKLDPELDAMFKDLIKEGQRDYSMNLMWLKKFNELKRDYIWLPRTSIYKKKKRTL